MKQKLVCHPDLLDVAEAAVRKLGREDEIIVIPNPMLPDPDVAYLVTEGLEQILRDDPPPSSTTS